MTPSTMFKDYIKYVSLNILGMLGLSCYILADTFFIAKGVGANGLTALNIAIPVYGLMNGCALMIGMGSSVRYTILKSQQEDKGADHIFTIAMMLTFVFSLAFFLSGVFFAGEIATALGADTAIYPMSKTYIQVILLFSPMFNLNNVILCFVRNDGAPQLAMTAMLGGSLANIILDYIFIFVFGMGLFGAVLATGIAPIVSLTILTPYFVRGQNGFHLRRSPFSFTLAAAVFSIGVPSLIAELSSGIVIFVFNLIILRLEGNVGVAGYGVIANISFVILSIYTGTAQGVQPILSSNYGAGHHQNVRTLLKYGLITILVLSLAIYGGIYVGASQIATIFNSEGNPVLQSIATSGLKIYFTACFFAGFNILMANYFSALERPLPAQVIMLLRGFLVIIPMTFLLAHLWEMTGVWWSFPTTELLVSLLGAMFYFRIQRRFETHAGLSKRSDR